MCSKPFHPLPQWPSLINDCNLVGNWMHQIGRVTIGMHTHTHARTHARVYKQSCLTTIWTKILFIHNQQNMYQWPLFYSYTCRQTLQCPFPFLPQAQQEQMETKMCHQQWYHAEQLVKHSVTELERLVKALPATLKALHLQTAATERTSLSDWYPFLFFTNDKMSLYL